MHSPESVPENESPQLHWDTNRSPNLGQTTGFGDSQQQKRERPDRIQDKIKRKRKER